MKKLVFLSCFLFLSVLLSANEKKSETENQTDPLFSRTKTEWVSIAAGYGMYGFEGDLTLFTFRWDRFFLETLKFHWGLKYRDTKANNIPRATIKFKTMLGFPLFLDKNNRNEIRFSGGMAVGYTTYEHRRENDFTIYFGSWIDIASEISYVLHISKHFALQIGASLDLPMYFVSAGTNLKYYRPDVYGFAGFRF